MKFDVANRFTGAVQFTAEIECDTKASTPVKLRLAVRWAINARANLTGADLTGANLTGADLTGADLTGANLARASLAGANLARASLAGANLARANLAGADLAGAYLARANLAGANLAGAYLARANLAGANLARADLARADLARADLARADLGKQWIIQGMIRADGYAFFLQKLTDRTEPMIKAGCRYFTVSEAQAHWKKTRSGTPLGDETFAIIDAMLAVQKIRGLT